MNRKNYRHTLSGAIIFSSVVLAGMAVQHVWAQAPAAPKPAAAPAAAAAIAVPRIVVIDRNVLLRVSSAGKDMVNQAQNLSKQADTEFKGQADQLQKDAAALQQQLAILAPDVRAQKQKDFIARQQGLQEKMQDRQAQIQNGFAKAGQELDQALLPILQAIMRERGANLMLERSAVILASNDIPDVTSVAVDRLDKALPHVKVNLLKGPPAPAAAAPAATAAK